MHPMNPLATNCAEHQLHILSKIQYIEYGPLKFYILIKFKIVGKASSKSKFPNCTLGILILNWTFLLFYIILFQFGLLGGAPHQG